MIRKIDEFLNRLKKRHACGGIYDVDDKDRVIEISLPQSSVGAPMPIILADEHTTIIAYYLQETIEIDYENENEAIAIVSFKRCYEHVLGPPNDEAFHGHPLASRGLRPYSSFEIQNSSWLRRLQNMNSVHPYHSPKLFEDYHHIVLSFHDSTFECIAVSYEFEVVREPFNRVKNLMLNKLR